MRYLKVNCDYCGKEIEKSVRYVNDCRKRDWKIYCSDECRRHSKRIKCNCAYCGKEIWKMPCEIKHSKYGNVFCNKSCACSYNNSHFRSNENNPNWKGGTGIAAYKPLAYYTYKPVCAICGESDPDVLEVHHIDKNRRNNMADNLIILCANHHRKVHRGKLEITKEIKDKRELSK